MPRHSAEPLHAMLRSFNACEEGMDWVLAHPKSWSGPKLWATCKEPEWLLWVIQQAYHGELLPRSITGALIELLRGTWDISRRDDMPDFDALCRCDANDLGPEFAEEAFEGQSRIWLAVRSHLDGAVPFFNVRSALIDHRRCRGGVSFRDFDHIDDAMCRALRGSVTYSTLIKRMTLRFKDSHAHLLLPQAQASARPHA